MKVDKPLVNFILIIIFFIVIAYLFKSVNVLQSDVSNIITASENQTIHNDVRFNYLIRQISNNFTITVFTVTILFGFVVFLTSRVTTKIIDFKIKRIKKDFKKQKSEYQKYVAHIKSIEGDLSFEIADKNYNRLKVLFENTEMIHNDYVLFVELSLVTCDYYSKSLLLKSDVYPKFEKSVKNKIKSVLSDASHLISTQDRFELINMGYERFLRLQKNIEQVCDLDDKQNLSLIFSKLDFPDLN